MKDLTQLEALQTTCELLAAAVTLREAAKTVPVNKAECLHTARWMEDHARANLDVPQLTFKALRGLTSADSIATDAQQIADRLLTCRDELRKEQCDAAKVFETLAHVSLMIVQLHANIAAGFRANAA